jgi:hypothetical protein
MKFRVSITREFDTDVWREDDPFYPAHVDPEIEMEHGRNLLAEELDYLVKYDEAKSAMDIEIVS